MQRVLTIALLLAASASAAAQADGETESEAAEADAADAASASEDEESEDDDSWLDAADEEEPQDGDEDWLDGADEDEEDDEWDFSAADEAAEDETFWDRLTFSVTSTTVGQYRFDNFDTFAHNDDYLSFWERLEMAAQADDLRVTARIDAFLALLEDDCPEALDRDDCVRDDLRLERFTAHWEHEGLKLDAVDSYAVFGRGVALSMRRVDILGIDNSLRGGQVAYDRHGLFIRALGGAANPQNLDPQTLTIRRVPRDRLRRGVFSDPELRDWVAGGELGVRMGPDDTVELALHSQRVWFARNETLSEDTTVDVHGFHLNAPTILGGKFAFYGEANFLQRDRESDLLGDRNDTGYGIYATAQASVDSFSVLLEWKDYSNYLVAETNLTGESHRIYSAAPTLERDQERPRALHNARGGRIQVDYGFQPGPWSLSGNFLMYGHAEDVEDDPFDGILVTHGYARLQKVPDEDLGPDELGWTMDFVAGARRESYLHDPSGDPGRWDLDWRVLHMQLDLGLVKGKHSLELTFIHRDERLRNFSLVNYERGTLSLTWSYAGKIRISPVLNWNTEQADNPSLYPGGEVRVDFLDGSFVRLFGGRTPGGRICSGGVCRDVPPFEGLLAEVVLRI